MKIKNIKVQNKTNIFIFVLMLFFLIFLFSGGILGGSAYNNASIEYELYENGKYYLESHNSYKEVTQSIYIYMKIIEPIGILSGLSLIVIKIYEKGINKK